MFGIAVKFVAVFLSNLISGITTKWMQLRESYKRGEAEAENEIHEENAKRKRRADKVMSWPIKKGKALIDSLRNRGNTAP